MKDDADIRLTALEARVVELDRRTCRHRWSSLTVRYHEDAWDCLSWRATIVCQHCGAQEGYAGPTAREVIGRAADYAFGKDGRWSRLWRRLTGGADGRET